MRCEQTLLPSYSHLHICIFFPASPACSEHCSPLLRLGEHFWVIAAGATRGGRTPSHPARVCKFSGLSAALAAAAAASWGRRGGTEQGSLLLSTAALGLSAAPRHSSSSPDGGRGPGGIGRLLLCCPKRPGGCFTPLLCCYPLNCTKTRALPPTPVIPEDGCR